MGDNFNIELGHENEDVKFLREKLCAYFLLNGSLNPTAAEYKYKRDRQAWSTLKELGHSNSGKLNSKTKSS